MENSEMSFPVIIGASIQILFILLSQIIVFTYPPLKREASNWMIVYLLISLQASMFTYLIPALFPSIISNSTICSTLGFIQHYTEGARDLIVCSISLYTYHCIRKASRYQRLTCSFNPKAEAFQWIFYPLVIFLGVCLILASLDSYGRSSDGWCYFSAGTFSRAFVFGYGLMLASVVFTACMLAASSIILGRVRMHEQTPYGDEAISRSQRTIWLTNRRICSLEIFYFIPSFIYRQLQVNWHLVPSPQMEDVWAVWVTSYGCLFAIAFVWKRSTLQQWRIYHTERRASRKQRASRTGRPGPHPSAPSSVHRAMRSSRRGVATSSQSSFSGDLVTRRESDGFRSMGSPSETIPDVSPISECFPPISSEAVDLTVQSC
eukprot:gnl/Dysnectes_brevis/5118_a7222_662.p1 GENE.gnl/Dysnectes_brevis/5118_a7222_662~~gnl/Dysnectes_brevis/5118_a7222_662.p1  ORF type:complete len:376 (-),score=50.11 gnl/Dysnectes_brevis/5118_a7222_662:46-1173(-)